MSDHHVIVALRGVDADAAHALTHWATTHCPAHTAAEFHRVISAAVAALTAVDANTGHADYEDTVEDLIRVWAAVQVVGDTNVWLQNNHISAVNLSTTEVPSSSELLAKGTLHRLGGIPTQTNGLLEPDEVNNNYHLSPVFRTAAHREIDVVEIPVQQAADPAEIATIMADRNISSALLKIGHGKKYPLFEVTLDADGSLCPDPDSPYDLNEWSWAASSHGAVDLIIQDKRQLVHEYRCFTSHGTVVAAAGCIEEFTPVDAAPGCFSPVTETVRGAGDARARDRVTALHHFAEATAAALYTEGVLDDYLCLDVAWDLEAACPVAVEVNPVAPAGFYASDIITTGYLVEFLAARINDTDTALRGIDSLFARTPTPMLSTD